MKSYWKIGRLYIFLDFKATMLTIEITYTDTLSDCTFDAIADMLGGTYDACARNTFGRQTSGEVENHTVMSRPRSNATPRSRHQQLRLRGSPIQVSLKKLETRFGNLTRRSARAVWYQYRGRRLQLMRLQRISDTVPFRWLALALVLPTM